jgi:hypothetical protein
MLKHTVHSTSNFDKNPQFAYEQMCSRDPRAPFEYAKKCS